MTLAETHTSKPDGHPGVLSNMRESPLGEAPDLYKTFRDKQDGCIKVVLKP